MIIPPWTTATTSVVYSLSALNVVCFCILLFKIKGIKENSLFVKLSQILIVSQILFVTFTFFSNKLCELN
jgi:hypothetical protein